jgi:hypothetical protein
MLYEPGPIKDVGWLVASFDFGSMLPKGTKAFGTLFYLGTSKLYEPGPTFWLSFKFCCVFSPLNTNAINFIYYYQQTLINDILG